VGITAILSIEFRKPLFQGTLDGLVPARDSRTRCFKCFLRLIRLALKVMRKASSDGGGHKVSSAPWLRLQRYLRWSFVAFMSAAPTPLLGYPPSTLLTQNISSEYHRLFGHSKSSVLRVGDERTTAYKSAYIHFRLEVILDRENTAMNREVGRNVPRSYLKVKAQHSNIFVVDTLTLVHLLPVLRHVQNCPGQ